jgi:hypothetical protein
MGFGVFIHRSDSIYDDSPSEQYQFPSQYLRRAEACVGDWIIYYEPRKVAETRGYFAIAKVLIRFLSTGRRDQSSKAFLTSMDGFPAALNRRFVQSLLPISTELSHSAL